MKKMTREEIEKLSIFKIRSILKDFYSIYLKNDGEEILIFQNETEEKTKDLSDYSLRLSALDICPKGGKPHEYKFNWMTYDLRINVGLTQFGVCNSKIIRKKYLIDFLFFPYDFETFAELMRKNYK